MEQLPVLLVEAAWRFAGPFALLQANGCVHSLDSTIPLHLFCPANCINYNVLSLYLWTLRSQPELAAALSMSVLYEDSMCQVYEYTYDRNENMSSMPQNETQESSPPHCASLRVRFWKSSCENPSCW